MQKFNYHTHTRRCGHADNNMTDEDFVKLFIQKGFTKIAFTDHCPEKEVEYLPGQEQNLLELKSETDKIILGQHFIYDENKNIKFLRRQKFTDEDALKYAKYIKIAIEKNIPDIIAHPDVYMLSRDNYTEVDEKVAHIICSTAEKYEIPIEINLSHPNEFIIGKRERIIYPCKEFWRIASEYKYLNVLYGVDAHFKYQIMNYEKAIEVANKYIGQEIIDKLHFCN